MQHLVAIPAMPAHLGHDKTSKFLFICTSLHHFISRDDSVNPVQTNAIAQGPCLPRSIALSHHLCAIAANCWFFLKTLFGLGFSTLRLILTDRRKISDGYSYCRLQESGIYRFQSCDNHSHAATEGHDTDISYHRHLTISTVRSNFDVEDRLITYCGCPSRAMQYS
ncbi:hypothetical protein BDV97DRAFT_59694 [Delphinella strobiligena]|nr:hypothetical protein BDV97DRAFT_59694 [Delphinella strobiligena]